MAKVKKIEERTLWFIEFYNRLSKEKDFPSNADLAGLLGLKSKSSISEILAMRQNIQPDVWKKFVDLFNLNESEIRTDYSEHIRQLTNPGNTFLLEQLMQQMTNLMQTQNNLLRDQKEQVVDKVQNIDANLKLVLGAVIKIESDVHASKEVALKSLARLEKLPEESLTGEVNKIVKHRRLTQKR